MVTVKGNLVDMFLSGEFDVIIHGCNCQNIMASGIAKEIATRIPDAKKADDKYSLMVTPIDKLSNYSRAIVKRDNMKRGLVINLYSQYNVGRNLDENALLLGFTKLAFKLDKDMVIGIPEIGCGIAGGDWSKIGPKIAEIMKNHNVTHVEYQK